MKSLVLAAMPVSVRRRINELRAEMRMISEFCADYRRHRRYSAPDDYSLASRDGAHLETQVIKDYHRVEKGLALANPKRPFGVDVAERLRLNADKVNDPQLREYALSSLRAVSSWNAGGQQDRNVSPVRLSKTDGLADPEAFFASRVSVRDFDLQRGVDRSQLERAITLAMWSPSVCNRQAWRVRIADDQRAVEAVLAWQNGNRGFGDCVPAVFIVTMDVRLFCADGERNQAWIDGGIFAMSLVYALHSIRIDSCMLNMSVGNKQADGFRSTFGIPDHEQVIMIIAAGHGTTGHRRARSPRRPLTEVDLSSQLLS